MKCKKIFVGLLSCTLLLSGTACGTSSFSETSISSNFEAATAVTMEIPTETITEAPTEVMTEVITVVVTEVQQIEIDQNQNEIEEDSSSSSNANPTYYKEAYKQKIQELSVNAATGNTIDYGLWDMNADGIPEMIVKTGTCEADYKLTFYTYENDAVTVVGDHFNGFHIGYYYDSDTNQFCTQWGQNGVGGITWYAFNGDAVTVTNDINNIEYATGNVNFDNIEDAYAPYGTFSDVEVAYCWNPEGNGWTTYYYTRTADGSYDSQEYSGIDYSLIDQY